MGHPRLRELDKGKTMRKKDLIKRIEILERQVKGIESPQVLEAKLKKEVFEQTKSIRENIWELSKTVEMWKNVFLTSGVISRCDADRTEYQWDEQKTDILGRNYHFKVNKIVTKKEKE